MSPQRRAPAPSSGSGSAVAAERDARQASLAASIPALRTLATAAPAAAAPPSLSERLARARIEDRRRVRNAEAQEAADAGASLPGPSRPAASLAGPGAAYLASLAAQPLREEALDRARAERDIRRTFAGPVPRGWGSELHPLLAGREAAAREAERACRDAPPHAARRRRSQPRQDTGGSAEPVDLEQCARDELMTTRWALGDDLGGSDSAERAALPSLSDLVLISIARSMSADSTSEAAAVARDLPMHMCQRLMALCGRASRAPALSDASVRLLLLDEDYAASDASASGAESSDDDDWDAAEPSSDCPSLLDLSYSSLRASTLRALVGTSRAPAVYLRSLSLAGTSLPLVRALAQAPNLEVLSLADCSTAILSLPPQTPDAELGLALRKLARATPKLRTLDLSVEWASPGVVRAVAWWDKERTRRPEWSELQSLVLHTPFYAPTAETAQPDGGDERLEPAGPWAGPEHANVFRSSISGRPATQQPSINARRTRFTVQAPPASSQPDPWLAGDPFADALSAQDDRAERSRMTRLPKHEIGRARVLDALWGRRTYGCGVGRPSAEVYF